MRKRMQQAEALILSSYHSKAYQILGYLCQVPQTELQEIKTYLGVSSGSFISLFLILGFTPQEISLFFQRKRFFLTPECPEFDISLYEENRKKNILEELLIHRYGVLPSLHTLYLFTGKSLICTVCNEAQEIIYLQPHDDTGDISCVDAVIQSIRHPLQWEKMHKTNYLDAMISNPYPLNYLDNGKIKITGILVPITHVEELFFLLMPLSEALPEFMNFTLFHTLIQFMQTFSTSWKELYLLQKKTSSSLCQHIFLETEQECIGSLLARGWQAKQVEDKKLSIPKIYQGPSKNN